MKTATLIFIITCTLIFLISGISISAHAQLKEGLDAFISSADVEIILPDNTIEMLKLRGPTLIRRSKPADADGDGLADQSIELINLELRGRSASLGQISIQAGAQRKLKASTGQIEELEAGKTFPSNSFVDTFAMLTASGGLATDGKPIKLVNEQPARLMAIINEFPPLTPHKGDNITFVCVGDINKDGIVDIFDLIIVARNFSQQIPTLPADQNPDINKDGKVDIFDIGLAVISFGEKTKVREIIVKRISYFIEASA
jgi:hypothetical protein